MLHAEIQGKQEQIDLQNKEMAQMKEQMDFAIKECEDKLAEHEKKEETLLSNIEDLKKQLQQMADKNAEISKLLNDSITKCESLSSYNSQLVRQADMLERENEEKKRELLHKDTELEALRIKVADSETIMKGAVKDAMEHAEQAKKIAVFETKMELQAEYEAKLNEILMKLPDMSLLTRAQEENNMNYHKE